jgi:hypothetical protein
MSYNLYVVAPKPYSEPAWARAMGLQHYLDFIERPTKAYVAMMARRKAQDDGEQAEDQGDVR